MMILIMIKLSFYGHNWPSSLVKPHKLLAILYTLLIFIEIFVINFKISLGETYFLMMIKEK